MSEASYELSEYELQRLERIRRNEEYLESLGLKSAKAKLMEMTQKTKRNKQRAKGGRRVQPGEERRSKRVQKDESELLMLSYADGDIHDMSPTAIKQQESFFVTPDQGKGNNNSENDSSSDEDDDNGRVHFRPCRLLNLEFRLTEEEKEILSNNTMDANYLVKFKEFLIYHNKISDQNVRNVMRQVTKLATGQGVNYDSPAYGWKPHQIFMKDQPVTPLSDFVELLELAKQAEQKWGRDHGNGWLLSHPLKKMLLFQQFCLQNPDFLSSKSRLKDYYIEQEDVEDDEEDEEEVLVVEEQKPAAVITANPTSVVVSDTTSAIDQDAPAPKTPTNTKKRGRPSSSDDDRIGSRVAKHFGDVIYFGTVQAYKSSSHCWTVVYDDDDREDMNAQELEEALSLFQEKKQPKKRKKGQPRKEEHVGSRVAKDFGEDEIYFGTVRSYNAKSKYFSIVYDDGDAEDFDEEELKQALALYQEQKANDKVQP